MRRQWPWYAMQVGLFFAVIASNVHWRWTDNPYVAALAAFLAVFGVHILVACLIGLWDGFRPIFVALLKRVVRKPSGDSGRLSRPDRHIGNRSKLVGRRRVGEDAR